MAPRMWEWPLILRRHPKGCPRYDLSLTSEERRSADNGIWLCQIHAKAVDDAPIRYPVEILKEWKRLSEEAARLEIEELEKDTPKKVARGIEALGVYSRAFDRQAFQVEFQAEMSISGFDRAIVDTIVALTTGVLRDRDGEVLAHTIGRAEFHNGKWKEKIGTVVDLLNSIRRRLKIALGDGVISIHQQNEEHEFFEIKDHALIKWMDVTRTEALALIAHILAEAGLPCLPVPPLRRDRW